MKVVELFVKGEPYPFQRPRKSRFGGFFNDPKYAAWKFRVCVEARKEKQVLPPYEVTTIFYLTKPRRPKYPWPSRNDWDNLFKGVLDGLEDGGVITDDRHVIRPGPGSCKKFAQNQSGVLIRVKHIPVEEI